MKSQRCHTSIRQQRRSTDLTRKHAMRVLIATDAWHPQVNGVVRTLTSLARTAKGLDVDIEFLTPEGFRTFPLPWRGEIARRIEQHDPDAIHLATEGPIGHAVRAWCLRRGLPFTTSYTT